MLLAFFVSSTLLSRVGLARKARAEDIGKTGPRDAWQVFANGGAAALCALAAWFTHQPLFAAAFAGAFAAACADTWGTEIGMLAKGAPRSVFTWKKLAPGLSGGVTALGTLAEIAGACAIGAVAAHYALAPWWCVAAGGIAGAFADSLLGATARELRYCESCARTCETDPHRCGAPTRRVRGAAWMNNDAVNTAATLTGAVVAALMWAFFR